MSGGIDAEAVHTELDEVAVALHEILVNSGVLGVKVHAVAGDLSPPAAGIVPVPRISHMVPVVVCVVVLAVGILHQSQTTLILVAGFQVAIV